MPLKLEYQSDGERRRGRRRVEGRERGWRKREECLL